MSQGKVRTASSTLTAWLKEKILDERGNHMPRLEVQERADQVETVSGNERNDDVTEGCVGRNQAAELSVSRRYGEDTYGLLRKVFPSGNGVRDGQVHGPSCTP